MTVPPSVCVFQTSTHKRTFGKVFNWEAYMLHMHNINAQQMLMLYI